MSTKFLFTSSLWSTEFFFGSPVNKPSFLCNDFRKKKLSPCLRIHVVSRTNLHTSRAWPVLRDLCQWEIRVASKNTRDNQKFPYTTTIVHPHTPGEPEASSPHRCSCLCRRVALPCGASLRIEWADNLKLGWILNVESNDNSWTDP